MSLAAELSRSQRAARAHAKQNKQKKQKRKKKTRGIGRNSGPPLPAGLLDDRCLTFAEWCQLNGIGARTGRRILAGPTPPKITQLSPRRIGIRVADNREWQAWSERK